MISCKIQIAREAEWLGSRKPESKKTRVQENQSPRKPELKKI
jgi:hypothetical protein